MLPIYICDDREEQLRYLSKVIDNIITMEELDMKLVFAAKNPMELIAYLKNKEGPSLYFLDIELKNKMNGLDLATEIRKLDPRGFIVFITIHDELAPLTFQYKVEAMDYISKDKTTDIAERVKECLLYALKQYMSQTNSVHNVIGIPVLNKVITLEQDGIICLEPSTQPHRTCIHTSGSMIEIASSMKEIQEKLDSRFYQCHKSCIINTQRVAEFDLKKHRVRMDNGKVCPVSIRLGRKLEQLLLNKQD